MSSAWSNQVWQAEHCNTPNPTGRGFAAVRHERSISESAIDNQAIPRLPIIESMQSVESSRRLTAADVKSEARAAGFDLCGIAPAASFPELGFLGEWLSRGYAGEMHYLHRTAERRADVRAVMPSAQSVISLGVVYNTDRPYSNQHHRCVSRGHRPLRVGRRLPRRHRAASARARRASSSDRRVKTSTRALTSTRARCRSACTRSTPASAGSGRTRA